MTTADNSLRTRTDTTDAKLTNWANEPTVSVLKGDLDAAKPYQNEQVQKINKWNDLMYIQGKAKPPKIKGRSSVQPKLIRKQAEWRYSALTEPFLGSNKLFKVSPVTFEDTKAARQNELVLNWQFRTKLNRVKLIDDLVRSVVDEGTGIMEVGWVRKVTKTKKMVPQFVHYEIVSEEEANELQQALEMVSEDPSQMKQLTPELQEAIKYYKETGEATIAVQDGEVEEEVETILENRPTVTIHNPANIYIDPTCEGDLDKALFAVATFETNYSELIKEKGKYKNLNKVDWESASVTTSSDNHTSSDSTGFKFKDKARNKVQAYKYWGFYDIHGNGELHPIISVWIGNTMIHLEESPFPDRRIPLVLIPYLPVKRQLYGEPDAELLEDNQNIAGATMRGMIDLLGRSANGQQGFAKGMLDPLNRRRYENGQDYEFNLGISPQQGLIEHKFPEIPQSALAMLSLQNQEAESLTGTKSFSGGITGEAYGQVAAGIRGVLDASSKREMAILRRIAKGISDMGRKIIAMNREFLSEEETIRVTNTEFETIRRDDLEGDFDLEVDISTAEVDEAKSQDLGFMLQTIGPNVDREITFMIFAEIAELKRMPELAHKIRTFKPEPDPFTEQMKQLELEEKQLIVDELRSRIMLNEAKARNLIADSTATEVDIQQELDGTKHDRNMAQQKAQSEGNQNLEVTKALTKPIKPGERTPDIEAAVGFNALSDRLNMQSTAPSRMPGYDPRRNLGSDQFDPSLDPHLNQGHNF